MGAVDPALLTESGERCIRRLNELASLSLPPPQLISSVGTVVEVHVAYILDRLIDHSRVADNPVGEALLGDARKAINSTWDKRGDWLTNPFGVGYRGDQTWERFKVVIEARNAVMHGDGAMSANQAGMSLPKVLLLRRSLLNELNIRLDTQSQYGADTSQRALEIARRFVAHFDSVVIARHPLSAAF